MHQPALKNMTSRIEDASMSIYQFLIAVRQKDATRIVENGIKPAYMSDGTTRVEEGSALKTVLKGRRKRAKKRKKPRQLHMGVSNVYFTGV